MEDVGSAGEPVGKAREARWPWLRTAYGGGDVGLLSRSMEGSVEEGKVVEGKSRGVVGASLSPREDEERPARGAPAPTAKERPTARRGQLGEEEGPGWAATVALGQIHRELSFLVFFYFFSVISFCFLFCTYFLH